ncbi:MULTISPECIES: acyl carrier protein [unclassified Schlesneria]|uniref:acyl carrier protein n=1 Tax=Schlesneria TaxID=656899 RepID=UPI002EF3EF1E
MDESVFLQQMDELFDLEPGTLDLSCVIEETPGWSSLTFLGLIALVDEAYQTAIKPRQLMQHATFGELYSYLETRYSSSVVT